MSSRSLKARGAVALFASAAMVPVAVAQSERLTQQESQYVNLLDDEEFEKANFYVQ